MRVISVILLNLLVLTQLSIAQDNRILERDRTQTTTHSLNRVALVIGNAAYATTKPLTNPTNDASDMAKVLKDLGFEVLSGTDLNKRQMEGLIREFGRKLSAGGTGVFYYAGHGLQVDGHNYLVPVDAEVSEEDEVQYTTVSLDLVLTKMTTAKNELNIIILDACRNNPFAGSWRSFRDTGNTDGLAKISPPTGTQVLYATEPGRVASDGVGRNGLFTESLLTQIKKPNLEYDQMVKSLSADVWQRSKQKQLPWKEGNSLADFYFVRAEVPVTRDTVVPPPVKEGPVAERPRADIERDAWNLIHDSADPQDFRDFAKDFPDGANARNARIRLEQTLWDSIKNSGDKVKLSAFLAEFPDGANAVLAKYTLKKLESTVVVNKIPTVLPPRNTGDLNKIKSPVVVNKIPTVLPPKNTDAAVAGTTLTNSIGMELIFIPAGEFMMGSTPGEIDDALAEAKKYNAKAERIWFSNEAPRHKVTFKQGFWMGKYEVTQGQWQAVMGDNPSSFQECGANCPVEDISWADVQTFVKRLNAKNDGFEYSVPSEAQWEYAARAGTTTLFAFGNTINSGQANFNGEYPYRSSKGKSVGKTTPVGSYQPNAWGLYDMNGNVWEWTQDNFSLLYPRSPVDGSANVTGGDPKLRVMRGGSWGGYAALTRSANRAKKLPTYHGSASGLRIAAHMK